MRTTTGGERYADLLKSLRIAALDRAPVSLGHRRTASPHEFYRYPARFSPAFARAAIEAFTLPGEFVLDPFVGGGTTLVEARLASRPALGSDLNPLAAFVTKVKARPCTDRDLADVRAWAASLPELTNLRMQAPSIAEWSAAGYLRNVDEGTLWRVRRLLGLALKSLVSIESIAARDLARCAVLRTAQSALDMRSEIPSARTLRTALMGSAEAMAEAANIYSSAVRLADATYPRPAYGRTSVIGQGLPGLARNLRGRRLPAPRLVLTSPPYPGVYVNYHRWKVRGRRETPALFWIADRRDGNGLSHYTMSARAEPTLNVYFYRLAIALADLALLCNEETTVVQMVGFHNPERDLPRYLDTLAAQGFVEQRLPALATRQDGRLWRGVPNRRWWTQAQTRVDAAPYTAQEVVLVHRYRV